MGGIWRHALALALGIRVPAFFAPARLQKVRGDSLNHVSERVLLCSHAKRACMCPRAMEHTHASVCVPASDCFLSRSTAHLSIMALVSGVERKSYVSCHTCAPTLRDALDVRSAQVQPLETGRQ